LFPYILFEKYIYILTPEMARQENQYCANCIGTLSFPVSGAVSFRCERDFILGYVAAWRAMLDSV